MYVLSNPLNKEKVQQSHRSFNLGVHGPSFRGSKVIYVPVTASCMKFPFKGRLIRSWALH